MLLNGIVKYLTELRVLNPNYETSSSSIGTFDLGGSFALFGTFRIGVLGGLMKLGR